MKIEGIATITKKGFHFDSGLPSNEPVLDKALKLHGTLKISLNACADFADNGRVYLPPEVHDISCGLNYRVKRTCRHYLIQLKVPVVESRKDTEDSLQEILPLILGDITLDRKELYGDAIGSRGQVP